MALKTVHEKTRKSGRAAVEVKALRDTSKRGKINSVSAKVRYDGERVFHHREDVPTFDVFSFEKTINSLIGALIRKMDARIHNRRQEIEQQRKRGEKFDDAVNDALEGKLGKIGEDAELLEQLSKELAEVKE